MTVLHFAVATTLEAGARPVADLLAALGRCGLRNVQPVFARDYRGLFHAVSSGRAEFAWCPPLVALELEHADAGNAIAAVLRKGRDHYYTTVLAHPDAEFRHLSDLTRARAGWVSKASASGYVVPRAYLAAAGVALAFQSEQFFETHARLARALNDRTVDFVATYADMEDGIVRPHPDLRFARVLGGAGPIPGDVVVATRGLPPDRVRQVKNALFEAKLSSRGPLAKMMHASGFGELPNGHFKPLAKWTERSKTAAFRPLLGGRTSAAPRGAPRGPLRADASATSRA
jgi:ABC-type phosphate/phosphonate transport system substrate-binding protein